MTPIYSGRKGLDRDDKEVTRKSEWCTLLGDTVVSSYSCLIKNLDIVHNDMSHIDTQKEVLIRILYISF